MVVIPTDGSLPSGRCLRRDVVYVALEPRGVAGQDEIELGYVDMRLVPVDQGHPIPGHPDVARVGIAMDDTGLPPDQSRPSRPAPSNTLCRHRTQVDLRAGVGVQEIVRRSPPRPLRPLPRQPMQLPQRPSHPPPILFRLRRPSLHISHHHQPIGEPPPIRRRNRHRNSQPLTIEIPKQLGLPPEIRVTPRPKPTNRPSPTDPQSPHLVGNPTSQSLNPSSVLTPLIQRVPSHVSYPTAYWLFRAGSLVDKGF